MAERAAASLHRQSAWEAVDGRSDSASGIHRHDLGEPEPSDVERCLESAIRGSAGVFSGTREFENTGRLSVCQWKKAWYMGSQAKGSIPGWKVATGAD